MPFLEGNGRIIKIFIDSEKLQAMSAFCIARPDISA